LRRLTAAAQQPHSSRTAAAQQPHSSRTAAATAVAQPSRHTLSLGGIILGKGWFITIEGIDGCGKTTQADRLCDRLRQQRIAHIRTREPGGTPIGDAIRALLLDPASEMTPATEVYLYAASRAEHVRKVIRPALAEGLVVVCDRYVDASVAYQGYGMAPQGMSPEFVREVNAPAISGLLPDLTMIIDIPVALALARLAARNTEQGDRIERRGAPFFDRVRHGLQSVSAEFPWRVISVDGVGTADEVAERIWNAVAQLIQRAGSTPCS
ncbi:MAG: dTMP kinase, partial [Bacilli bacterium]